MGAVMGEGDRPAALTPAARPRSLPRGYAAMTKTREWLLRELVHRSTF